MARLDLVVDIRGRGGQRQRGLRHIVARVFLDQAGELAPHRGSAVRTDHDAIAAGFIGRLDHQLVEVLEHMLAVFLAHAEPGGHAGQQRFLLQVIANHVRHKGVNDLVIRHPTPRGIGDGDITRLPGAHQARDTEQRLRTEGFRVHELLVDAPVDDVHTHGPVHGAHIDAVVVRHHQVTTLDQLSAHALREVGMLKVSGIENTRCEHDYAGAAPLPGGQGRQRLVELRRVVIHRQNTVILEQFRQHPLGDLTVFQHVGHPGRHPQVVFEHPETAVTVPHQVRPADMRPHPEPRRHAHALRFEVGRLKHDIGGHHAVGQNFLPVVNIVDEVIQGQRPLAQAVTDRLPLTCRNDPGNDVERPGAVDVAGLVVDGKRDTHFADGKLRSGAALRHLVARQLLQQAHNAAGGRARLALGCNQLVKEAARRIGLPTLVHRFDNRVRRCLPRLHKKPRPDYSTRRPQVHFIRAPATLLPQP